MYTIEKIDNDFLTIYNRSKKSIKNIDRSESLLIANHEDISSFMKNVSDFFIKKVKDVTSLFDSNGNNNVKSISKGTRAMIKELSKEDKKVEKIANISPDTFKLVSKIVVPWIPGIDVDYPTLVKSMEPHIYAINNTGIKLLEEANTFIAKLGSDEEFRLSMVPSKDFIKRLTDYNKITTDYLESLINGKKIKDNIELGEILPDGKAFLDAHSTLKNILGSKDVEYVQNIFDMSNDIAKRTMELHDTLLEGDMKISRTRTKEMPVVLKESAQLVTNCAGLVRILDAASRVHNVLLTKLSAVAR